MINKKNILGISFSVLSLGLIFSMSIINSNSGESAKVSASSYTANSVPKNLNLNDTTASNVRSYYSDLNSLSTSERRGTNLLKHLKPILKDGQTYYSYGSGATTAVWQIYEIIDRDWEKSPASQISGYNAQTNTVSNYSYGSSNSSVGSNPYVHALYVNRNVTNQTRAWGNHNQDQWGINQEHVWAKSCGFEDSSKGTGARGDVMHLWAGNGKVNGTYHSNYYYGYVDKNKSYDDAKSYASTLSGNLKGYSKSLGGSYTVFEPQDSDKGDIARALFYMAARYNYLSGSDSDGIDAGNPNLEIVNQLNWAPGTSYTSSTTKKGQMGILQDLLEWNRLDPPDAWEIHRNNLCYNNFTHNRNPFIDFPEWAEFIWGTSTNGSYSSATTGYATPSSDTINSFSGSVTPADPVAVTGVTLNKEATSIQAGKTETLTATVVPSNATDQVVTWTSSNTNVATVNGGTVTGVAEGNSTITVTTHDGSFTATCAVTVTADSGGGSEDPDPFEGSVTAASGALSGWTASGTGSAYSDGAVKFDSSGDYVYKTDIFSGAVSANMKTLTVTINGKNNGTDSNNNSYRVEAITSNGTVVATQNYTGLIGGSYGDKVFTFDGTTDLSGVTGLKITYVTKGSGNWGVKSVSWSATYTEGVSLSSISLNTDNAITTFTVGDTFSYSGLVVTAHYSNSTSKTVTPTSVSSPDMSTTGQKTVTVSYTEGGVTKTETYSITVNPEPPTSITATVSKTYYVGDTISKSDITVIDNNDNVLYDFEFSDDGYQFTYDDAASGGALTNKYFDIYYDDLETTLTVQVQRKAHVVPSQTTDTLNQTWSGITGTSYVSWTDKAAPTSDAVYAGNCAGSNSSIQLRSSTSSGSNVHSGIVSTTSGGTLSSVTVVWQNSTSDGRTLNVYGKNTAYTNQEDLYSNNADTQGTLLGTIVKGTSTSLTITGSYTFIGLRSNSSAMYLTSISITYGASDSAENLANYIMYTDTTGQCNTKYPIAVGYFKELTSGERSTFMTSTDYVIETARERLEAWATAKGQTISYSNNDYVVKSGNFSNPISGIFDSEKAFSPCNVVLLIAILGFIVSCGCFYSSRKKEY